MADSRTKRIMLFGGILAATLIIIIISLAIPKKPMQDSISTTASTLLLTSSAFAENGNIPDKYTCAGENTSPPLEIKDIDPDAKSLVLIVDDPDAPAGVWDHWIKWNIPPTTMVIEEGKEPEGIAGKGSSGNLTYKGPCPPSGTHHYRFKLYALDTTLDLAEGSSKADVEKMMAGHIIQQTQLTGLYSKK